jgi:cytochrome c peroxidase
LPTYRLPTYRQRTIAVLAALAMSLSAAPAGAADGFTTGGRSLGLPRSPAAAAPLVSLGAALFADPRLSPDGRFSCASCHRPEAAFAEAGIARPLGRDGRPLARNAPGLGTTALQSSFGWDGGARRLEKQVLRPLTAAREMGNPSVEAVAARLSALPDYSRKFARAFAGPPTGERIAAALAAYVRSLASGETAFDRWRYGGDGAALSPAARRGFALFRAHGCSACHLVGATSAPFTDGRFHDTGIAARRLARPLDPAGPPDPGRAGITGRASDVGRFRTPSLRGVARTPPYMHDGSIRSLAAVVRYYAAGGVRHPGLSPLVAPFRAGDRDVADLVAFLESL